MDTLKKNVILNFSLFPSIEGLEDNKLILITPAGTITGTYITSDDDNSDTVNVFSSSLDKIALDYRQERNIPDDKRLDGNDGFIPLKDVTILNGVHTTNLPFLCVFYDQIIGVSLGNLNRD